MEGISTFDYLTMEKETKQLMKGLRVAEQRHAAERFHLAQVLAYFHFGRYPTREDWETLKEQPDE